MPYQKHELFEDPDSPKLYRYISYCKFEELIKKKSLYFCRSDMFSDPFEGSVPFLEFEHRKKRYPDTHESTSKYFQDLKKEHFISCWHYNTHESDVMWSLYSKEKEGICIESTFDHFKTSFDLSKEDILIGKVFYIDFEKHGFIDRIKGYNCFLHFIHKRKNYAFEQEYRAIVVKKSCCNGLDIEVDLNKLITKIILSPFSSPEFEQKVKSFLEQNKANHDVVRSALDRYRNF